MQQAVEYLFIRLQVLLMHQLEFQVQVTLIFYLSTGINKIIEYNKKKKKRKSMIKFLCWLKVNSIVSKP